MFVAVADSITLSYDAEWSIYLLLDAEPVVM